MPLLSLFFQFTTCHTSSKLISLLCFILTISFLHILSRGSVLETDNIPRSENPMIIGVPRRCFSDVFVKIESTKNPYEKKYSGFCIDVFVEVAKTLSLQYRFVEFNGTYNDLIDRVADKTFDAAVGDMTILADRWRLVDFTASFTESGVSLVAPLKPETPNPLMFLTPFTMEMWVVTGAILIYTMFTVWFLEHRSNPEFRGSWKDQLGNALWFTFSSLFFSHREHIENKYTRVVVVVWLFVVLVLTQSYTASLTSMLTISRLQPNIELLQRTNAKIGYYGTAYVCEYLQKVLRFKVENVKEIYNEYNYLRAFESGSISAAFLEAPYAKSIVTRYCKQYTIIGPTYRFGGFGFVFQKGSPITANVSEAIQRLLENGTLKKLEDEYFAPSSECSNHQTTKTNDSLSLHSFWVLYLFSAATSTICFLLFTIRLLKNYRHHQEGDIRSSHDESSWNRILRVVQYLNNAEARIPVKGPPTSGHAPGDTEMRQTPD